jgi:hypothetical protein
MQNLCSLPNALFRGTKVANHPFYSIWTKIMFGSASEHFTNLRHVNICKTCVSGLNALFRGTKVAKRPFYSIRTKMMFGSVLKHFANLRHVKRCKTCFRVEFTVSVYQSCEATILLHWNENYVWECFTACSNLRHVKTCKTCVRTRTHYFRVPKLWSIHSKSIRPNMTFGSVSEHFC